MEKHPKRMLDVNANEARASNCIAIVSTTTHHLAQAHADVTVVKIAMASLNVMPPFIVCKPNTATQLLIVASVSHLMDAIALPDARTRTAFVVGSVALAHPHAALVAPATRFVSIALCKMSAL